MIAKFLSFIETMWQKIIIFTQAYETYATLFAVFTLVSTGLSFVLSISKHRKIKAIAEAFSIRNKREVWRFSMLQRQYIPHIAIHKGACITAREVKQKITQFPFVFISGPSGIGKSMLMIYLCARLRRHLFRMRVDSIFRTFAKRTMSLGELLEDISNEIRKNKCSRIYVFIDGLDEARCLGESKVDAEDVMIEVKGRFMDEIYGKEIHVIISSRLEVFGETGFPTEMGFEQIRLNRLNSQQIEAAHGKLSTSSKKNKKSLRAFLKACEVDAMGVPDTIFSNPLLIRYIDTLLELGSLKDYNECKLSHIYSLCISHWINHDYSSFCKSKWNLRKSVSLSDYQNAVVSFLEYIAGVLIQDKKTEVRIEELPIDKLGILERKNIITRSLLVRLDNNCLRFIHSSLYNYFSARFLKEDRSIGKRYPFFINNKESYDVFIELMYTDNILRLSIMKSLSVDSVNGLGGFRNLLLGEQLLITSNPHFEIRYLLDLCIYVKSLTFREWVFDGEAIVDLRNGILDVSNSNIESLAIAEDFGPLSELYIQLNRVREITVNKSLIDLRTLDITDNPFDDFSQLQQLTLQTLYTSIANDIQLSSIINATRLNLLLFKTLDPFALFPIALKYRIRTGIDIRSQVLFNESRHSISIKISNGLTFRQLSEVYLMDSISFPSASRSRALYAAMLWFVSFYRKDSASEKVAQALLNQKDSDGLIDLVNTPETIKKSAVALLNGRWSEVLAPNPNHSFDRLPLRLYYEVIENYINMHLGQFHFVRKEYELALDYLSKTVAIFGGSDLSIEQQYNQRLPMQEDEDIVNDLTEMFDIDFDLMRDLYRKSAFYISTAEKSRV